MFPQPAQSSKHLGIGHIASEAPSVFSLLDRQVGSFVRRLTHHVARESKQEIGRIVDAFHTVGTEPFKLSLC